MHNTTDCRMIIRLYVFTRVRAGCSLQPLFTSRAKIFYRHSPRPFHDTFLYLPFPYSCLSYIYDILYTIATTLDWVHIRLTLSSPSRIMVIPLSRRASSD